MVGDTVNINIVRVGELECNCYILEKNNNVLVIDPGDEIDKICFAIGNRNVVGVIITHYHFDHVGALQGVMDRYDAQVYDIHNMNEGINNIFDFRFNVIYTPGHKEDAITIYFEDENIMFIGDFIFRGSVGRCDLPGGSRTDMVKSIDKIKKYRDCLVYPGHGDSTTLEYEKENNIYFYDIGLL